MKNLKEEKIQTVIIYSHGVPFKYAVQTLGKLFIYEKSKRAGKALSILDACY